MMRSDWYNGGHRKRIFTVDGRRMYVAPLHAWRSTPFLHVQASATLTHVLPLPERVLTFLLS